MNTLNPFQRAVASKYGGGDFSWISKSNDWRRDIDLCGDALFQFLMIELSTKEGCDTWDDAAARMDFALRDLLDVVDVVHRRGE